MKKLKYNEEQIIRILQEAEVGMKGLELCRKYGVSDATYYNWKAKYGGLTVNEGKSLKARGGCAETVLFFIKPVKDTLCRTKALRYDDYEKLAVEHHYFGDFDLLIGAAKLNVKILDLPIRYHASVADETNINRWSGGWLLLCIVQFAAQRIKFV